MSRTSIFAIYVFQSVQMFLEKNCLDWEITKPTLGDNGRQKFSNGYETVVTKQVSIMLETPKSLIMNTFIDSALLVGIPRLLERKLVVSPLPNITVKFRIQLGQDRQGLVIFCVRFILTTMKASIESSIYLLVQCICQIEQHCDQECR